MPMPILHDMWDYSGGGGGGGGGSASVNQRFFYLVIKTDQQEGALRSEDVQKFFRTGTNTSADYAFTVIDIATDDRLKNDVLKMEDGPAFYERLEASVPSFLVTYAPMPKIVGASVIKMYPVRDYDKDINVIYESMGLLPLDARKSFAAFLRKMNGYLNLKPNVVGLGVNLNQIIDDWIERLERSTP